MVRTWTMTSLSRIFRCYFRKVHNAFVVLKGIQQPPHVYVKKPECPAQKSGDEWLVEIWAAGALKLKGFFHLRKPRAETRSSSLSRIGDRTAIQCGLRSQFHEVKTILKRRSL